MTRSSKNYFETELYDRARAFEHTQHECIKNIKAKHVQEIKTKNQTVDKLNIMENFRERLGKKIKYQDRFYYGHCDSDGDLDEQMEEI